MNKRDIIAWQLWCEKQPREINGKWQYVSRILPIFLFNRFAKYVSMKFMGTKLGVFHKIISFMSFWFVCRVVFPLTKQK